jgi:hypothetical protein
MNLGLLGDGNTPRGKEDDIRGIELAVTSLMCSADVFMIPVMIRSATPPEHAGTPWQRHRFSRFNYVFHSIHSRP